VKLRTFKKRKIKFYKWQKHQLFLISLKLERIYKQHQKQDEQ